MWDVLEENYNENAMTTSIAVIIAVIVHISLLENKIFVPSRLLMGINDQAAKKMFNFAKYSKPRM